MASDNVKCTTGYLAYTSGMSGGLQSSGVEVVGGDSNEVIFCDCQRNTLCGLTGLIPVVSKAPKMLFLVYAVALAHVTSL